MKNYKIYKTALGLIFLLSLTTILSCNKNKNKTAELQTIEVTDVTQISATSGGSISFNEGPSITASGVCWSTKQNPTITDSKSTDGSSTGSFVSHITGLTANTKYYVRAYATNINGTAYGNQQEFITTCDCPAIIKDADSNEYHVVNIAGRCWTVENLRVTRFQNDVPISNITDPTQWSNLTTAAFCYYNNDIGNVPVYGFLYNWYAVANPNQLAPNGWHIPSKDEYTTLVNYLGGESSAGGKMKDEGTTYWHSPNIGATNSSGFTAVPAGYRYYQGNFSGLGMENYLWTSTEDLNNNGWYRSLNYANTSVQNWVEYKTFGYSVRCIRD